MLFSTAVLYWIGGSESTKGECCSEDQSSSDSSDEVGTHSTPITTRNILVTDINFSVTSFVSVGSCLELPRGIYMNYLSD